MPYSILSLGFERHPFYNLDTGVGSRRGNLRGDVLLVQFFLRDVFEHPMGMMGKPDGILDVTGKFNSTTGSYILAFQREITRNGHPVTPDGQIDAASRDWPHCEAYTIWQLERVYHDLGFPNPKLTAPPALRSYMREPVIETHGGGI